MKYIAFVGCDGSGKTYTKDKVIEILKKNNKKVYYEYGGIKKFRYLKFLNPILRRNVNKKVSKGQSKDTIKYTNPIIKFISPFIYYIEHFCRYVEYSFKQNKYDYFISDRGYIDIVVSPNVNNKIAYFLYIFLPKPKQILMFNDLEVIYKRRNDHPKKYLKKLHNDYLQYRDWYYSLVKSDKDAILNIMLLIQ